ncbi:MAG: S-layer homology domain-containing protein [Oscillospiraceae bacterium]|nr:S-layer homology domain-containing protein [Oscillospiraceae bacterium]
MKKIISALLSVIMLSMASTALASFGGDEDKTALLSELNIMVGDLDGDFRLDSNVSRAEFAKMAVASSKSKNTVAPGMKTSPFKDVPYTHWSAPYVRAAVSAGFAAGYIDATFRPDNTVSYEEALTMILKVLGYTDDDFGYSWPYGQIGLAENLEITKNVNASVGEALTRRQVANLIYNALNTKMKNSAEKLISVFDCQVIEGVTIVATNNEDSALGSDKVFTTAGTFEFSGDFNSDYVGRRGDIVVKNGDDFVAFTPREQIVEEYTVSNVIGSDLILDGDMYNISANTVTYYKTRTLTYETAAAEADKGDKFRLFKNANGSVDYGLLISDQVQSSTDTFDKYVIYSRLNDAVIGYRNGSFEEISITDGTACYKDNIRSTYAAVKNEMAMGDILYVKKNGNGIDYVSYEKGNMEGPVRVTGTGHIAGFPTDNNTAVMRSGVRVTASDLRVDDIIYYSADLNMVLAYTDKITGVYEKALPTKDSPTSVIISGKEYAVESVEAFNDLSSSGKFNYGDTVTLLLGRYGSVAGVSGGSGASSVSGGFVIETGKKDFTNPDNTVYSSYYAKVVTSDGIVNEYATNSDYSSFVCSAVRITFKNGKASLSVAKESGNVYGKVNASRGKVGDIALADDVKILDTSGTYPDDTAGYCRIYPQRIDGVTLTGSNVLYSSRNGAGEIDELILKDVTGDTYSYGIIVSRGENGLYKIDFDGTQNTYMTSFSSSATGPHRFKIGNSGIDSMIQLVQHTSSVTNLTRIDATIGNQTYLLSDKVVVYHRQGPATYMKIPIDDAINGKYRLTAYYDKAQASGGRIRIIIAQ